MKRDNSAHALLTRKYPCFGAAHESEPGIVASISSGYRTVIPFKATRSPFSDQQIRCLNRLRL